MSRRRLLPLLAQYTSTDEGHAWYVPLPRGFVYGDHEADLFASALLLLEDGMELGPAHAAHDDIRKLGAGRYSHWKGQLWFATSDNSSPLDNGRRYDLLLPEDAPGRRSGVGVEQLPDQARFALARRAFLDIWPHTRLPDIGRRVDLNERFAADFRRVSPDADYSYERKYNLDQLFRLVAHLPGDVAECGTYKGASAYFLGRHILHGHLAKRLYLFDSFQGLSAPADADGQWWRQGDLACSLEDLRQTLALLPDIGFIEVLPGWIPERFPEVADRQFCFVHIDLDLAQPTADALEFFYPRMVPGGLLLFDDYGHASCPGVTAVVDGYFAGRPEPVVNLASGGAFVQRR